MGLCLWVLDSLGRFAFSFTSSFDLDLVLYDFLGAGESAALLRIPGVAPGAPACAEGGPGLVQLPGPT